MPTQANPPRRGVWTPDGVRARCEATGIFAPASQLHYLSRASARDRGRFYAAIATAAAARHPGDE